MVKIYWKIYLFTLIIFLGLLVFFSFINPLTVYDADDWLYIYSLRKPIPILHDWNPIRVFPETTLPLVSYFGAYVLYPITNNYFRSLSLAHGLFASILLTMYFVQFVVLFYKRNFASLNRSIAYGFLFILLHFISHIFKGNNNYFLLGSINLTCFHYYTLSAILNAILVMHFMSYGGVKEWFKYRHNVVDSYITIKDVKASKEKNEEFGIDTISLLKRIMQSVQEKFNK